MALLLPTKDVYWLLDFVWSQGERHFTTSTTTKNEGGVVYSPLPVIDLEIPPRTGTLSDEPAVVEVPADSDSLFEDLSSPDPHAEVDFTLREKTVRGSEADVIYHHCGVLDTAISNIDGKPGVLRLTSISPKQLLSGALGMVVSDSCPFVFGRKGCLLAITTVTGFVSFVQPSAPQQITLDVPVGMAQVNKLWERGYLEKDGVRITIKSVVTLTPPVATFELVDPVPSSWILSNVTVSRGCTKQVNACTVHNNIGQFGGIGLAMASHNPVFELP